MAARFVFKVKRSCHISYYLLLSLYLLEPLKWLRIEKRIEEKILTIMFKACNGLGTSYLTELLDAYVPARMLRSSDTPTLTVPNFKLKTVGDRSLCSLGRRLWNSPPHSLRASALACSDAIPVTVIALLRVHLLANHFSCLSSDQTLLLSPFVERVDVRKRADSLRSCEHAIKNPPR